MFSSAQIAICLMAYTDLLAQRKWAFDLRLSQLKHILHNSIPLTEVLQNSKYKAQKRSMRPKSIGDGEPNFLKTTLHPVSSNLG